MAALREKCSVFFSLQLSHVGFKGRRREIIWTFSVFFLGKTKIKDKWWLKKKRERKCLFARQGAISEARLDASRKAFVLSSARAQSLSGVLLGMATTGSAAQSNSVRSFCLSFFLFLSLGLSLHVTSLSVRGESRVQYFFFLSRNPFWKENNAV